MTRLQRASEGSGESAGGCRDDVIQGGGMRLQDGRRDLVVLRHRAMYAEYYRLLFGRKICSA